MFAWYSFTEQWLTSISGTWTGNDTLINRQKELPLRGYLQTRNRLLRRPTGARKLGLHFYELPALFDYPWPAERNVRNVTGGDLNWGRAYKRVIEKLIRCCWVVTQVVLVLKETCWRAWRNTVVVSWKIGHGVALLTYECRIGCGGGGLRLGLLVSVGS